MERSFTFAILDSTKSRSRLRASHNNKRVRSLRRRNLKRKKHPKNKPRKRKSNKNSSSSRP
jgi:hypothetical protein